MSWVTATPPGNVAHATEEDQSLQMWISVGQLSGKVMFLNVQGAYAYTLVSLRTWVP